MRFMCQKRKKKGSLEMKKFLSLILALCMVMSMAAVVMADTVTVNSHDEAQAALDAATNETVIQLVENVDYGTLIIRPVDGNSNTITGYDYLVYRNEMLRKVENLTIKGATGATVDAIVVESGYIEGSTGYVVDISGLTVDSVEFNDTHTNPPHSYASPLFFDLSYINVDGLTVKNCTLDGGNDHLNFVYFYGSQAGGSTFETAAKNITITGNTVSGIARLCELREAANVTITDNVVDDMAQQAVLLSNNTGAAYSGEIEISGNEITNTGDRALRIANVGADATVVIEDNEIEGGLDGDGEVLKFDSIADGATVTATDLPDDAIVAIKTNDITINGEFSNLKMEDGKIKDGAFETIPEAGSLADGNTVIFIRIFVRFRGGVVFIITGR